jgi:hypothetical protein
MKLEKVATLAKIEDVLFSLNYGAKKATMGSRCEIDFMKKNWSSCRKL